MFIYLIRNKLNGKLYVGLTALSVAARFALHVKDFRTRQLLCPALYRAFAKYGLANFEVFELDSAPDKAMLAERERHWIRTLHTQDSELGYNISAGGYGGAMPGAGRPKGTRDSIETRGNKSRAQRCNKNSSHHSPEVRARIAAATAARQTGQQYSTAHREAIRAGVTAAHVRRKAAQ